MLPFPAHLRRLILSFHNQFNSYPATLYPKGCRVIRKHSVNGAGEDSNAPRIVKAARQAPNPRLSGERQKHRLGCVRVGLSFSRDRSKSAP
jgi:hypothetical protein